MPISSGYLIIFNLPGMHNLAHFPSALSIMVPGDIFLNWDGVCEIKMSIVHISWIYQLNIPKLMTRKQKQTVCLAQSSTAIIKSPLK